MTRARQPQIARQAKRLTRQQKHLEKELISKVTSTIPKNSTRLPQYSDLIELEPLTDKQADVFDSYENGDTAMMLYGSAGTGKTMLAIYHALTDVLYKESDITKLVIIRSCVQSRQMGFTPGDANEKMQPYENNYIEIVGKLLNSKGAYEKMKEVGMIEFASTSFLRGTTFDDCVMVVDEAQNMNWQEINTILTRVGRNCKLILCGDGLQNDLIYAKNDQSGFGDLLNVTKHMPDFRHFKFTSSDIVRSEFVKSWIMACEKFGL